MVIIFYCVLDSKNRLEFCGHSKKNEENSLGSVDDSKMTSKLLTGDAQWRIDEKKYRFKLTTSCPFHVD